MYEPPLIFTGECRGMDITHVSLSRGRLVLGHMGHRQALKPSRNNVNRPVTVQFPTRILLYIRRETMVAHYINPPHPSSLTMALRSEPSSSPPSTSVLFRTNSVSVPNSPSRSPRRLHTDPRGEHSSNELRLNVFKRIVVFCDGFIRVCLGIVPGYRYFFIRTWQDGISEQRAHYTNVLVSCILWRVAVRS